MKMKTYRHGGEGSHTADITESVGIGSVTRLVGDSIAGSLVRVVAHRKFLCGRQKIQILDWIRPPCSCLHVS